MGSYLYSQKTEEEKIEDMKHDDGILSIYKIDENTIASGSTDTKIVIYDYRNSKLTPIKNIKGSFGGVSSLLAINDKELLSGDTFGNLYHWDLNETKLIHSFKPHSWHIYKLEFINYDRIASCSYDNDINIYEFKNGLKVEKTLKCHTSHVFDMVFIKSSNILVTGSNDCSIVFWDLSNKDDFIIKNKKNHESKITALSNLKNGLIAVGSADMILTLYETNNFSVVKTLQTDHTETISEILELNNGDLITGSFDYTCNIYDKDLKLKHAISKHTFFVSCIIQMNNGVIITGSEDSRIYLFDENNYNVLQKVYKA